MKKFYNYTPDGRYYILTVSDADGRWMTALYIADRTTGQIDFSVPIEWAANKTEEGAFAAHQKFLWKWSGNVDPDEVLGIGEGYY